MEQQQAAEVEIKIGDCLKEISTRLYGIVYALDQDGDYRVIDSDGDNNCFLSTDAILSSTEELYKEKKIGILPYVTSEFHGILDFEKRILRVGCQEVEFGKLMAIAKMACLG